MGGSWCRALGENHVSQAGELRLGVSLQILLLLESRPLPFCTGHSRSHGLGACQGTTCLPLLGLAGRDVISPQGRSRMRFWSCC